jgi:hypothetical protein
MAKKINKNETCFSNCKKNKSNCANEKCRAWFDCKKYNNCSILASEDGPMTLQNIGDLFKLTRMRICQIEKNAISKIREMIT